MALVACGGGGRVEGNRGLPQGSEKATLDPADFSVKIDDPYLPMASGERWVYRAADTAGTNESSSSW